MDAPSSETWTGHPLPDRAHRPSILRHIHDRPDGISSISCALLTTFEIQFLTPIVIGKRILPKPGAAADRRLPLVSPRQRRLVDNMNANVHFNGIAKDLRHTDFTEIGIVLLVSMRRRTFSAFSHPNGGLSPRPVNDEPPHLSKCGGSPKCEGRYRAIG